MKINWFHQGKGALGLLLHTTIMFPIDMLWGAIYYNTIAAANTGIASLLRMFFKGEYKSPEKLIDQCPFEDEFSTKEFLKEHFFEEVPEGALFIYAPFWLSGQTKNFAKITSIPDDLLEKITPKFLQSSIPDNTFASLLHDGYENFHNGAHLLEALKPYKDILWDDMPPEEVLQNSVDSIKEHIDFVINWYSTPAKVFNYFLPGSPDLIDHLDHLHCLGPDTRSITMIEGCYNDL